MTALDKAEFTGGLTENLSSGNEGLACALEVFNELREKRKGGPIQDPPNRYLIFVSTFPSYDMPIIDSPNFAGLNLEQTYAAVKENNVRLSIFSPRKISAWLKMFEQCGGELSKSLEKNFAKDPRDLILLNGFTLQERPLTPKPQEPTPSPVASIPSTSATNMYGISNASTVSSTGMVNSPITSTTLEQPQQPPQQQHPPMSMQGNIMQPNMMRSGGPASQMSMASSTMGTGNLNPVQMAQLRMQQQQQAGAQRMGGPRGMAMAPGGGMVRSPMMGQWAGQQQPQTQQQQQNQQVCEAGRRCLSVLVIICDLLFLHYMYFITAIQPNSS